MLLGATFLAEPCVVGADEEEVGTGPHGASRELRKNILVANEGAGHEAARAHPDREHGWAVSRLEPPDGANQFVQVKELPLLGTGKLDLRGIKKIAMEAFGVEPEEEGK